MTNMDFSITYGEGVLQEGRKKIRGKIILDEHKLFLRRETEDIAASFIPLEKIKSIRKKGPGLLIDVRLSIINGFTAYLEGEPGKIGDMREELVRRLNLKKRFLRQEWDNDSL